MASQPRLSVVHKLPTQKGPSPLFGHRAFQTKTISFHIPNRNFSFRKKITNFIFKTDEVSQAIEKSYFWEAKEMDKFPTGKIFPPLESPIPTKDAKKLPPIKVRDLNDKEFELKPDYFSSFEYSLLLVSFRRYLVQHYLLEWRSRFSVEHPEIPVFELSWTEQKAYKLISSLLKSVIRKDLGQERYEKTFLYSGENALLRNNLGLTNSFVPYVFLLDKSGQIRWKSVGKPTNEDFELFSHVLQELQQPKKKHLIENKKLMD
eukprot:TRINITY_DN2074_c0_g7_i1.p1 TRINITY_DN2074_c0_g7~~TRINITY_DN2074_c0_g7_i1.p1  ORF type:complete len:275 (+),score=50.15 TRINITY_DN2074_c0_g7_i1:43-825(+)